VGGKALVGHIPPPPPADEDEDDDRDDNSTKASITSTQTTPAMFNVPLKSTDPKHQELERENLECKARLQTELTKVIEELEIKFKEFEMRLDRCMAKQCLRVQKHRQVIQVYQKKKRKLPKKRTVTVTAQMPTIKMNQKRSIPMTTRTPRAT